MFTPAIQTMHYIYPSGISTGYSCQITSWNRPLHFFTTSTDIVSMSLNNNDKLVILFAFAWAAFIYMRRASSRSLPLPPGPKRLPLIGNLLNVPRSFEWEAYARWGKEFGMCVRVIFRRTQ